VNFDYAQNNNHISNGNGNDLTAHLNGLAVAAHQALNSRLSVSARGEYMDDLQGYSTGTAQLLREITGTVEYHWKIGLLSRAEYRHDWSDEPYFHLNDTQLSKNQQTFTIGLIAVIAPNR
jgi:hypothetical protein